LFKLEISVCKDVISSVLFLTAASILLNSSEAAADVAVRYSTACSAFAPVYCAGVTLVAVRVPAVVLAGTFSGVVVAKDEVVLAQLPYAHFLELKLYPNLLLLLNY